jgi:hypothetical protein
MTKKIVAVLALSLVASNAFASQAKNIVTGGGDAGNILCGNGMCGSFYTNDEYNMFWNPAFINGQKNWAIIENGANSGTSAGFVTNMGAVNVGAFFNRPVLNGGQALDLVVGGDMGAKWGIGLTQTLSQDNANKASSTIIKAGVVVADFEPFVSYAAKNTANGTTDSSDFTVGTRYHYGEWTPYAAYRDSDANGSVWGLGLGRNAKMGDVSMDYSLSYWNTDAGYNLPLALTFTADAASWLAVRAGFQHALRGAGGTTTTLGGTIKLGKADLDMVVGQGGNGETTISGPSSFGFSDNLFANAGLTYRW